MKCRLIIAASIAGLTVPALLATVFLFGCCVLPFHGVMHKLMPVCDMAASIMRGDHGEDGHSHDDAAVPPAREKQEPVKRIALAVPDTFRFAAASAAGRVSPVSASTSYRSFITLGAIRCDRDVGLSVLDHTFLI